MVRQHHQQGRGPRAAAVSPARRGVTRAAVLLLAALMLPALTAAAPPWRSAVQEQLEPNTLVRPPGISLEQAANEVRRQTGGRVLSASPSERGGQRGYEVRVLLEDGKRVKTYFVDGKGRVRARD